MTSLLVSDLDGTLLNSAKAVSETTATIVNDYLAEGGLFTIATARMAYGCDRLVAGLDLRLPGIVMNGAALYSFTHHRYEEIQPIPQAAVAAASEAIADAGAGAFVYAVNEGRIQLGCARPEDLSWTQYNSERARQTVGDIPVLGFENWDWLGETIYIAATGADQQLTRIQTGLGGTAALAAHPYHNVYSGTECLEYSSSAGGKASAVLRLKELVGAQHLIVFGDNHNDLEMMRLADRSFAPAGSSPGALTTADEVIESNDDDGVAKTIRRYASVWLPNTDH